MNFFFRKPVFPVIVDIGNGAMVFHSPSELERHLTKHGTTVTTPETLIDSNYEGFSLTPDKLFVSPLALKKNYTKKELLDFCGISDPNLTQKRLQAYSKADIFDLIYKSLKIN